MNIIEKEILAREERITAHENDVVALEDARMALEDARKLVADLEAKVISFNKDELVAEIEELKTYLPKEENEEEVEG